MVSLVSSISFQFASLGHQYNMLLPVLPTAQNQRVMANNLGLVFGKRQLINGINCTQPTTGRFADSCDYTQSFGMSIVFIWVVVAYTCLRNLLG